MAAIINFYKGNAQGHTWVKFNWNYGSGDIKVQRSEGLLGPPHSLVLRNSENPGLGRIN